MDGEDQREPRVQVLVQRVVASKQYSTNKENTMGQAGNPNKSTALREFRQLLSPRL
jgi:hypothetical protein